MNENTIFIKLQHLSVASLRLASIALKIVLLWYGLPLHKASAVTAVRERGGAKSHQFLPTVPLRDSDFSAVSLFRAR